MINGLQDVEVPEGPNPGGVISGGLSGAATGASIGGPWGAVAGAAVGVASGIIGNAKKRKAVKEAKKTNAFMKANRAYAGEDPTEFQSEQIYPNGTSGIVASKKSFDINGIPDYTNFVGATNTGRRDPSGNEIMDYNPSSRKRGANQRTFVKGDDGVTYRVWGNHAIVSEAKRKLSPSLFNEAKQFEPVVTGAGFQMPGYENGTKAIEVERDELIFQRDKLGQFKLKADFKGGKSHAQGGEDYVAQEGDVIFPGKMRNKVLAALKKKDYKALETMRQRLPKDTVNGQAKLGLDANTIMGAAGVANNLVQSFMPVEKVNRTFYNPETMQYEDRSAPLRAQSRSVAAIDAKNARNLSGGNAGNLRANLAQSKAADFIRQQNINNQEQSRADAISNQNVGISNQARAMNTQLAGRYDELQSANRAARDAYRDTAMEGISQMGQIAEQKKYMQSLDAKRLEMDEKALEAYNQVFPNYMYDNKAGKIRFK